MRRPEEFTQVTRLTPSHGRARVDGGFDGVAFGRRGLGRHRLRGWAASVVEPGHHDVATAKPSASVPKLPPLLNPKATTERAPDSYQVQLDTTKGKAIIQVHRDWAPRSADRFYNLVKIGYYDDVPIYRVTLDVAQFGFHGDPKVTQAWSEAYILRDVVKQPNSRGRVAFAHHGADTRTTHIYINLEDNFADFDEQGYAPFGEIVEGMDAINKLENEYDERTQMGDAPKRMRAEGSAFIKKEFPKLDYIKKANVR